MVTDRLLLLLFASLIFGGVAAASISPRCDGGPRAVRVASSMIVAGCDR